MTEGLELLRRGHGRGIMVLTGHGLLLSLTPAWLFHEMVGGMGTKNTVLSLHLISTHYQNVKYPADLQRAVYELKLALIQLHGPVCLCRQRL